MKSSLLFKVNILILHICFLGFRVSKEKSAIKGVSQKWIQIAVTLRACLHSLHTVKPQQKEQIRCGDIKTDPCSPTLSRCNTEQELASLPNLGTNCFPAWHSFYWALWARFPQRNLGLAIHNLRIALNHTLLHSRLAFSLPGCTCFSDIVVWFSSTFHI